MTIALSKLKPWERNPKRISKAHAARLLDLWERLGQFQTIAIGPGGEVYDGHQRLSVLKAKHGGGYVVQVFLIRDGVLTTPPTWLSPLKGVRTPGWLSTSMRPWCASTARFTIESPSPVPLVLLVT